MHLIFQLISFACEFVLTMFPFFFKFIFTFGNEGLKETGQGMSIKPKMFANVFNVRKYFARGHTIYNLYKTSICGVLFCVLLVVDRLPSIN